MTGKASFSGIALATISLRPTLDADCAGVGIACIIAAWSCAAWMSPPADEGASPQRPGLRTSDPAHFGAGRLERSEEHTSELQSLMRISYAVFCFKKKNK